VGSSVGFRSMGRRTPELLHGEGGAFKAARLDHLGGLGIVIFENARKSAILRDEGHAPTNPEPRSSGQYFLSRRDRKT